MGRLNSERPASLLANLLGACAILYSLFTEAFNLSAVAMEGSWVLVSAIGLVRWALKRLSVHSNRQSLRTLLKK